MAQCIKFLTVLFVLSLNLTVSAQRKYKIVEIIDNLRYDWDQTAISLKDYQGIQNFCETEDHRKKTLELLDAIHHWDTTLYFVVKEKYDQTKDKEAEATLKDIERLESNYTTINFKEFIQQECDQLKVIHDHFDEQTVKDYEKAIRKFEKELIFYLNSITDRVDIVDEHIHHLDL